MTTESEIYARLLEPFPQDAVHWRVGATNRDKTSGIALAYIDARDVMDRLDESVGMDSWQDAYVETAKGRILCALSLRINGEWITKADGAGETDVEGDKGGISDAFKRAAVKFGVGRYLYRLPNKWVPIKPRGKSFVLESSPSLPSWALPGGTPPDAKHEDSDQEDEEPFQEEEPKKRKRFHPRDEINKKLEIISEKINEQEVRAWLTMFLKHEPLAKGELTVGGIQTGFDEWKELYEHFKIEANRAFDMGFNERKSE